MTRQQKIDPILEAAKRIKNRCPDEWHLVVGYIRKQAYAVRMDAELDEQVKAEYHRKSMATQILTKFGEKEGE